MIKLNLKVNDPSEKRDRLTKTVYWAVVPRKGEMVSLLYADCQSEIEDVHHWLDSNDINVICKLDNQKEFDVLIEHGWQFDGR